ncbi:MAG: hypothetical protein AAF438_22555, partial [Pseudomonadota bacterium]
MAIGFILIFVLLIVAELLKGLSANGTPPVLQKYAWQMDLAYVMWSSIAHIRMICFVILAALLWQML